MSYTIIPQSELEIFNRLCKEFKVVFDIGCRDDVDYFHINPSCEYHLFEPNTIAINSLKQKLSKLNNHRIILNEFGLSDISQEECCYYRNIESFTINPWVGGIDYGDRFSLKTLDEYIESNNIEKIDFLKIDVEGLDYKVILGGLETIKNKNMVSYIQIEYNGGIKQYVDLLENFDFYWMMEPLLLNAVNNMDNRMDFNKSLIKLDIDLINFIDNVVSPTGNGGNILGINKQKTDIDIDTITFKII
jgi:FkbM family methyltransferase